MSDLADHIDPTAPLERVPSDDDRKIERGDYLSRQNARLLRIIGCLLTMSGREMASIRESDLGKIEPKNVYVGQAKDGLIPVLLDI